MARGTVKASKRKATSSARPAAKAKINYDAVARRIEKAAAKTLTSIYHTATKSRAKVYVSVQPL